MKPHSVAALVVACVLAGGGCIAPESPSVETSRSGTSKPVATTTSAASSPTPSGRSPTPTEADGSETVTVVMNGDLLWHDRLWTSAAEDARSGGQSGKDEYDFAPLFAGMKPVIAGADLAICHEEVPLAPPGGPYKNYPSFAAPPQVVKAIKSTGYDLCTTASNHSLDQGFAGLQRTLNGLDDAGILHAGTAQTRRESLKPTVYTTADGVKIAVVSATYGLNGIPRPDGKAWSVKPLEAKSMLADAKRAKQAGADIVIAAMHAGEEYSSQEIAQQRSVAKALTASPDVDLVYGHHAHVAQPWTRINGKWVAYGLGNTVAQQRTAVKRGSEGVTARFTFTSSPKGGYRASLAEYIPTYVSTYAPGKPARLYRVSEELKTAKGGFRARLIDAQKRTDRAVRSKKPAGLIRS